MPKFSINLEEILSLARGNSEDQSRFLETFIIIINYFIIITNTHYKYIIYLLRSIFFMLYSNKGLLEECDKEENDTVTVAGVACCLK